MHPCMPNPGIRKRNHTHLGILHSGGTAVLRRLVWCARCTAHVRLVHARTWNSGPPAVVSAARGCAPSSPVPHVPRGASE